MVDISLVTVVEVPKDERVYCQAPHCKHPVFKRIHVVRQDGHITVLGSECFKKLFGEYQGTPRYGSSEGRLLSPEERELLIHNTERLIERFEAEHQAKIEEERRAEALRERIAREREAAREAQRRADEERARLNAERHRALMARYTTAHNDARPAHQPRAASTNTESDPRYQEVLAQVKQEFRAKGLDPEQAGWRGMLMDEVKRRLR